LISIAILIAIIAIICTVLVPHASNYIDKIVQKRIKDYAMTPEDFVQTKASSADVATEEEYESPFEVTLKAPTQAGIQLNQPTVTNLDRNTWYEIRMRKLDDAFDADRLFVVFKLSLNLDNQRQEKGLMTKWKELHPLERQFDLEYIPPEAESTSSYSSTVEEDENRLKLDSNFDSEEKERDTASFYWNNRKEVRLRVSFNALSSQYPFSGPGTLDPVPFVFQIRLLSQTTSNMIDTFACQVGIKIECI